VRAAVDAVTASGTLPRDLGGAAKTAEVTAAVVTALPGFFASRRAEEVRTAR
jgi:hypothetical protein